MSGALKRITLPYTKVESFFYDRIIAPAVASFAEQQAGQFIAGVPENGSILDAGCGGGQLICVLKKLRPGLWASGLDLSKEQVLRAMARTRAFGNMVDIQEGSALRMPYDSGSFDLVISVGSIKHWLDRARGLQECVRVLKPGGKLLVFEIDKDFDRAAGMEFVGNWNIPSVLRPLAFRFFTKYVAKRSLGLDDAQKLAAGLSAPQANAAKVAGFPAWVIRAGKTAETPRGFRSSFQS